MATSTGPGHGSSDAGEEPTSPLFDVGMSGSTGEGCDETDFCCLAAGAHPPHTILDAFLDMYPSDAMPKSVEAVLSFEPTVDGHAMAWSPANGGNELVDPGNGGVIPANIEAGRLVSLEAAEVFVPDGGVVVAMREDSVEIDPPDAGGGCIGTGWGWGSILFETPEGAFGELVYLYIGHCAEDGDVERFFHSDQAVQVCDAPG